MTNLNDRQVVNSRGVSLCSFPILMVLEHRSSANLNPHYPLKGVWVFLLENNTNRHKQFCHSSAVLDCIEENQKQSTKEGLIEMIKTEQRPACRLGGSYRKGTQRQPVPLREMSTGRASLLLLL
jgi:hypothetical protein